MSARTPRQESSHHRLLPHERWFADYGARRGPGREDSGRSRMQQNYGPEGMALLGAAIADGFPGSLMCVIGIATLAATGSTVGGYLILIGVLIALLGIVRTIQGARAARIYRNGRPFIRPGSR